MRPFYYYYYYYPTTNPPTQSPTGDGGKSKPSTTGILPFALVSFNTMLTSLPETNNAFNNAQNLTFTNSTVNIMGGNQTKRTCNISCCIGEVFGSH